jgi:hypothetical protein
MDKRQERKRRIARAVGFVAALALVTWALLEFLGLL